MTPEPKLPLQRCYRNSRGEMYYRNCDGEMVPVAQSHTDFCLADHVFQLESAHAAALAELARVQASIVEQRGVTEGGTCIKCGGLGTRAYGSTATWRGGIGGQQITLDVCDRCWGSGDETRRWPSHRLLSGVRGLVEAAYREGAANFTFYAKSGSLEEVDEIDRNHREGWNASNAKKAIEVQP